MAKKDEKLKEEGGKKAKGKGKKKGKKKDKKKDKKSKKKSNISTDFFSKFKFDVISAPPVEEPPKEEIAVVRVSGIETVVPEGIPPIHNYLINLNALTKEEEVILQTVLKKDASVERSLDEKVNVLRNEIKMLRTYELNAASESLPKCLSNRRKCFRCTHTLGVLGTLFTYISKRHRCQKCMYYACKTCLQKQTNGQWICSVCLRYREIFNLTGEWAHKGCSGISGSDLLRASLREKAASPAVSAPPTKPEVIQIAEATPEPAATPEKPEEEEKKKKDKKGKGKKGKGKKKKGKDKKGKGKKKKGAKKGKKDKGKKDKNKNKIDVEEDINVSYTKSQSRENRDEEEEDQDSDEEEEEKEEEEEEKEDSDIEDTDESSSESSSESRSSQDTLPVGASAAYQTRKLKRHQTESMSSSLDASWRSCNWPSQTGKSKYNEAGNKIHLMSSNHQNLVNRVASVNNSKWDSGTKSDIAAALISNQHTLDTHHKLGGRNDRSRASFRVDDDNTGTIICLSELVGSGAVLSYSSLKESAQTYSTETTEEPSRILDCYEVSGLCKKQHGKYKTVISSDSKDARICLRTSKETSKNHTESFVFSRTEGSQGVTSTSDKKFCLGQAGADYLEEQNNNLKKNTLTVESVQSDREIINSSLHEKTCNNEKPTKVRNNAPLLINSYYCEHIRKESNVIHTESYSRKQDGEETEKKSGNILFRALRRNKMVRKVRCFWAHFLNTNESASLEFPETAKVQWYNKNRNFHEDRSLLPQQPEIFTTRYSRKPLFAKLKKKKKLPIPKGEKKPMSTKTLKNLQNIRSNLLLTTIATHATNKPVQEETKAVIGGPAELVPQYVEFGNDETQTESKTRHKKCYPCSFCRFYYDYGAAY